MGAGESAQRLGERVRAARKKLELDTSSGKEQIQLIKNTIPTLSSDIINSLSESLNKRAPLSEEALLLAWFSNSIKTEKLLMNISSKVLQQPIIKTDYMWFREYVLNSSVWFFKSPDTNKYLYQSLLDIAQKYSFKIQIEMDNIYKHLMLDTTVFNELISIKNVNYVTRQDDKKVNLLSEDTIKQFKKNNINNTKEEKKQDENDKNDKEKLENFIDMHFATNILITVGQTINKEFQDYIGMIMSQNGKFQPGPTKVLDRCLSKLENDYYSEAWPRCAKILDICRCSVTFNTVTQLINGYKDFINHVEKNKDRIEIARIKNGFVTDISGGYRDLKINVIFHSITSMKKLSMIMEVQFILVNYLWEKKKMHRLYSILRQKEFFDSVVGINENKNDKNTAENYSFSKLKKLYQLPKGIIKNDAVGGCLSSKLMILCVRDEKTSQLYFYDTKTGKQLAVKNAYKRQSTVCFGWFNDEKYFAYQDKVDKISIGTIIKNEDTVTFNEIESMNITTNGKQIHHFDFDANGENIVIVIDNQLVQKRNMKTPQKIETEIVLNEKISYAYWKILSLGNAGRFCCIAGGVENTNFFLIDLVNKTQKKFIASKLVENTYSPCFIGENDEYLAIGGSKGGIEIWNIDQQKSIRFIKEFDGEVTSIHSIGGIMAAVCFNKTTVKVWNVKDWSVIFSEKIDTRPLHLTLNLAKDATFVTVSGRGTPNCALFQVL